MCRLRTDFGGQDAPNVLMRPHAPARPPQQPMLEGPPASTGQNPSAFRTRVRAAARMMQATWPNDPISISSEGPQCLQLHLLEAPLARA